MNVIIVGLRRSGTTAFWETWRQDARFGCYNEPFNPRLREVADPAWPGRHYTAREFRARFERGPAEFWEAYAPIYRHYELARGLSDQQGRYITWLLGAHAHACTDVTRCHFKVRSLHERFPDALLIHLYRPPQNWVTSVTLPSTGHFARKRGGAVTRVRREMETALSNYRFRRGFWERRAGYGFKGFEDLIGTQPDSLFGVRLREAGLDPEAVYAMPAVGRLLAFWRVHFERVEADGRACYGDRFASVNFNDFCRAPLDVMRPLYERAGLPMPALDVSGIHPPPAPFAAGDPRWEHYLDRLQIPRLA